MHASLFRRALRHASLIGLLTAGIAAQDAPFNTTLLSNYSGGEVGFADIWGEGDFAYQARNGRDYIDILDVSNPFDIQFAARVTMGGANASASAQDVKTGDGLLFIALESANPDGAVIVDVRDPYSPQILTYVDPEPGSFEQIHNLFYDNGWLYLCNSSNTEIAIVDLRTFDPDNAPSNITSHAYRITGVGGQFVHDITVQDGVMYAAAWDGLYLYDVSNLGQQSPQLIKVQLGSACHAIWPTDDGQYIVTGEERKGGAVRLYEVEGSGPSLTITQRDSLVLDVSESFSAHNVLVSGNRVYASWYQAGGMVLEIDRDTKSFECVAQYDTDGSVPFSFGGNWGIYPFLGADQVLLSDLARGTYVVDMSALEIDVPSFPSTVVPDAEYTFTFDVAGLGNAVPDSNAVEVFVSVSGSEFSPVPALSLGGGQYQASLPTVGCQGEVDFYVAATDTQGRTFTDPGLALRDGEETYHRIYVADGLTSAFADDFESDQGWTVDGDAFTGIFTLVNPVGSSAQPEDDDPDASGTRCYVTGQGDPGGDGWEDDLDGGFTSITSPAFDMSAGDGLLSYSYWFFNGKADDDSLLVELSNDGGASWATVTEYVLGGGGWRRATHRVSDTLLPTADMVLRFTATDTEDQPTVTEVAIDEVHIDVFGCSTGATVTARNGSGLNPSCLSSSNLPVVGTTWAARVDGNALAGTSLTYLFSYTGTLAGVFLGAGEVLVDPTSAFFFTTTAAPAADGVAVHPIAWPNDPSLVGVSTSAQALLVGAGLQLCNALDLVLDN